MGYQLRETDDFYGVERVGVHPRVYKTRLGAWIALFFTGGWFFLERWWVIPAIERDES